MKKKYVVSGIVVVFLLVGASLYVQSDALPFRVAKETIFSNAEATPSAQVATLGELVNLTNDSVDSRTSQFNGFQVGTDSSNRIHAVFRDNHLNSKIEEVYYKRYNGTAWEPVKKLSNIASLVSLSGLQKLDVSGPTVAVSPTGDVHVVWSFSVLDALGRVVKNRKIYYQRSTDGGVTFAAPVYIGEGGDNFGGATICYGSKKVLLSTQKIVNIIATGVGNRDLYAYYSANNGATFKMSPITAYQSAKEAPVCAVAGGGTAYVVWQDDRDGTVVDGLKRRDIHFARSSDSGATWTMIKNITNTPGAGSSDASMVVDTAGKVHVAYHDDNNDGNNSWEIYYVQSPDRGTTWGTPKKLTSTAPTSGVNIDVPSIAVTADGKAHIVWQDQRSGYLQIFYMKGSGEAWEPEISISGDLRATLGPSIVVGNGSSINVLWSGLTPAGARDVFYRKIQ